MRKMALAALFFGALLAQNQELSLEDAIKIGLQNNPQIVAQRKKLDIADSQIDQAIGTAFPVIDATFNYTRNIEKPVVFIPDFSPEPISMSQEHIAVASLKLWQPIWIAGKTLTAYDITKLNYGLESVKLSETENSQVFNIIQIYYAAVLAKEQLSAMQNAYKNAVLNAKNVRTESVAGTKSEFDSLQAVIRVLSLEPELRKQERNLIATENQLKVLLSIPVDEKITLKDKLIYRKYNAHAITESELFDTNPQVLQSEAAVSIAEKYQSLDKSDYYPEISGKMNYSRNYQSDVFSDLNNFSFNTFTIGLDIKIPIFSGLTTSKKIEQSRLQVEIAQTYSAQTKNQLRKVNQDIYTKITEANDRVLSQKRTLELGDKMLSIARLRYQNGLSTQLDLNTIENNYLDIQLAYLYALYEYELVVAEHKKLKGELTLIGDGK
jgi:outer membrane protein TolC